MARACTLLLYHMILARLAAEDFRTRTIRNKHCFLILCLAMVSAIILPEPDIRSRVLGAFLVSVPMLMLSLIRKGCFGGGDIKLVFASGAFLGSNLILRAVLIAVFLAGLYSLRLLFTEKKKENHVFAFGPFLSIGCMISSFHLFL